MIKQRYKPGIDIISFDTINNYTQIFLYDKLCYKGYYNNGKFIKYQECYSKYQECYSKWLNKGIKYIV